MSTDFYAVCYQCAKFAHIATRFAGCERFRSYGQRNKTDDACTFLIDHADCTYMNNASLLIVTKPPDYNYSLDKPFTEVKTTDGAK